MIRGSNKTYPFKSYRGGSPSTEELRQELESLYKFIDAELKRVVSDVNSSLNSHASNLSSLQETVAGLDDGKTAERKLSEYKEEMNHRLVAVEAALVADGIIVIWSGILTDIPKGWLLCDGTNGTPNLVDKFVKGVATSTTDPGSTGGTVTHSHAVGTLAMSSDSAGTPAGLVTVFASSTDAHTTTAVQSGTGTTVVNGPSSHSVAAPAANFSGSAMAAHTHTMTGDTDTEDNIPPYYEVAFIMKKTV